MKVLVVRAGALGDILLLRRAVSALQRAGHQALLAAPRSTGRVLLGPGPAEVRGLVALDGAEVAALLAGDGSRPASDVDAVLALTRDHELVGRLLAPGTRVLQRDPEPPPGTHAARWLAEPVRELGADPDEGPETLRFSDEEREGARPVLEALPDGFLAVHPGAGSVVKAWPAERFARLVEEHARGQPWLLVAGPADAETAAPLRALPGVVLARSAPARVLGAALGRAGLFVGNDSGVSHLAAAAGAPTLGLFGPTEAAVWGPEGQRVATVSSGDGTMEGLGYEAVAERVAAMWGG